MLFKRGLAAMLAVAMGMAAGRAGHSASAAPGSAAERTGGVIVRFQADTTLATLANSVEGAKSDVRASTGGSRLVLVQPHAGESVDDAVARLNADPSVEFAEPDTKIHIAATPTDPLYAADQTNLPQLGLPSAWDTTTGSAGVTVAVLDTGLDGTHPEFSGRTVPGYNFIANNTNTADDFWHGTFVAGIIAADTNNGQGIAGICWSCKIMPVKVLDSSGSGSMFGAAQGIDWAVAHGAKVINMSFGGSAADAGLQTAVNNAWAAGVVLVAAAGNDNSSVMYPAAFSNVIAVGSVTAAGGKSSFSNFGPELDVVAPGEEIWSTDCTCGTFAGDYGHSSGTSFASPEVAGIAALMVAAGNTNNATVVSKLKSTATDLGPAGFDNTFGNGRVNAAGAVGSPPYGVSWGANTLPTTAATGATLTAAVSFTNIGSLSWPAGGSNAVHFAYHWRAGACPGTVYAVWDGVRTSLSADVSPGASVTGLAVDIAAPNTDGTYCLVYDLVREGVTWFSNAGATTQMSTVIVNQPVYGVAWGADSTPGTVPAGATTTVTVSFMNTGSLTWSAAAPNPVRLAYHWRAGACPGGTMTIWDGARTALPVSVASGGSVTSLSAKVIAPDTDGAYCLIYDLVREGVTWFSSQGASTSSKTVTISTPVYAVSWGADTTPASMAAGTVNAATISFTNSGSLPWNDAGANPVHLAYHWRAGACPGTAMVVWDGARTALPADVARGGSVTGLTARIIAPPTDGTYCLVYDLVREGVTWFSSQGASTKSGTVTVSTPLYGVSWGADATPASMVAGSTSTVNLSVTNTGSLTWSAGGANAVHVAYHWRVGACPGAGVAVWDGERTALPVDIGADASVTGLAVTVSAPGSAGVYCLQYDLVREGMTWFSQQGVAPLDVTVTVP